MQLIQPEIGLILWGIFIICLLYFWILTIVRIAKSDFIDHRTKMVWGVVVFFLPLLGMLLYYAIGRNQRINNR
jgi:hypothetical protein